MQGKEKSYTEAKGRENKWIKLLVYRTTIVSQIMTKNPLCVTSDTSATEALDLMVTRGFRHLVSDFDSFVTSDVNFFFFLASL